MNAHEKMMSMWANLLFFMQRATVKAATAFMAGRLAPKEGF